MNKIKDFIKKIYIHLPNLFVSINKDKLLRNNKWIYKLSRLYSFFIFIPGYKLKFFFNSYSNKIKQLIYNDKKLENKLINNLMESFLNEKNEKIQIFIINFMFDSSLFNDESLKESFIYLNKNLNKKKLVYWFLMNVSFATFISQKGIYNEFYRDRKELMINFAKELNYKPKINNTNNQNRLLILTYMLYPSLINSMQRVAQMVSNGIVDYFDEVTVLSLESMVSKRGDFRYSWFGTESSKKDFDVIKNMFNKKINVKYIYNKNLLKHLYNLLDYIYEYNPNYIIDINDELSVISYYYSNNFNTTYIPMRNYASSSSFNKFVGKLWKCEINYNTYHSFELSKVRDWAFPEYIPPKGDKFDLGIYNIDPESFKILTISNNNETVCDTLMIDEICNMVDSNNMVWLFVGGKAPLYLKDKYNKLIEEKKIIECGFINNLSGLCRECDILLRSNTTGGSGGTAIAAQQGLPVVMTNYICDPMRWLGKDYSNLTNFKEVKDEILKLLNDKEYYKSKSDLVLKLVGEASNFNKKWFDLSNIIKND